MYTDIFAAGVSILRTEIEILDKISLHDIQAALHSNTIIVEGLDYQSYVNKRIKEVREKINPIKTFEYHPDIKKFTFLKIKDFTPQLDQKSLREQYGEVITRFLSGETSSRALHSKEIMEKIDSLQDLYPTARELSTEQLALWIEIAIVLLSYGK